MNQKRMKVSDYIKSKGGRSLKALAEDTGFHVSTLNNWYRDEWAKIHKLDPAIDRHVANMTAARMAQK